MSEDNKTMQYINTINKQIGQFGKQETTALKRKFMLEVVATVASDFYRNVKPSDFLDRTFDAIDDIERHNEQLSVVALLTFITDLRFAQDIENADYKATMHRVMLGMIFLSLLIKMGEQFSDVTHVIELVEALNEVFENSKGQQDVIESVLSEINELIELVVNKLTKDLLDIVEQEVINHFSEHTQA